MWKIILIILLVLYILSPYDLLPDMMMGWGWIDDLVLLVFVWRYIQRLNQKRQEFQKYQQSGQETHGDQHTENNTGSNGSRPGSQSRNFRWDPYAVLEIERGASPAEIKSAYRRLAGLYHPDKVEHLGEEFRELAEKRFKEIQQAYEELRPK